MPRAVAQGDHICSLFETEEGQLAVAAAYVAEGLRRGERCFYVAGSEAALKRFRTALAGSGIDPAAVARSGALLEATSADAHLAGGTFDSERMLALLNDAVEAALNAGFTGLRTCGDMSWLLDEPAGAEHVVEYEALLNQFFRGVRATGMCQYDRRRLPAHIIDHALATHGSVAIGGRCRDNPFYEPPEVAVKRTPRVELLPSKLQVLHDEA